MLPKTTILDTNFGKYMLWQSDTALFKRLADTHLSKFGESLVYISRAIIEVLQNYSHNKVVIDVGANAGCFSIPLANSFTEVKFYCFEVQRLVYYQLCGNIFLNNAENILPFNIAVGNETKNIKIPSVNDYTKMHNVGGYSINNDIFNRLPEKDKAIFNYEKQLDVTSYSLDTFPDSPHAGLIKIDVEGLELQVLKGASNYLKKSGFPPILFEAWNYSWYQIEKRNIIIFLKDIGYDLISAIPGDDTNYLAQSSKTSRVLIEFQPDNLAKSFQIVLHIRK